MSLFCGAGGMDLRFLNTGFDITWSNDMNKYVVEGDINDLIDRVPSHDVLLVGFYVSHLEGKYRTNWIKSNRA